MAKCSGARPSTPNGAPPARIRCLDNERSRTARQYYRGLTGEGRTFLTPGAAGVFLHGPSLLIEATASRVNFG